MIAEGSENEARKAVADLTPEMRANKVVEPLRQYALAGIEAAKIAKGDAPETLYEIQKQQVTSRLRLLEKNIAAEIRAVEQAAREKTLREAAALRNSIVALELASDIEAIDAYRDRILRLLEEKNE